MSDLDTGFQRATRDARALPQRPGNDVLLQLYGLYKQATQGDASVPAPRFFDFVGTAKHDAWASLRGTQRDDAKRQYIDLVDTLRG